MKLQITSFLLALIILSGCADESDDPSINESKPALESFILDAEKNNIPVRSEGIIEDDEVILFLPPGTDVSALTPDFTISGNAQITANGEALKSGESMLNFNEDILLKLTTEDGASREYTLVMSTDNDLLDGQVEQIMDKYSIPGLQLAITYKERLVYVNSYGYADKDEVLPVKNNSLFRIASISKAITLVTILHLIENEQLDFDDKIFGAEGVLGFDYGTPPYKQYVEDVTIRHLLEHKSGWTNYPFDPMFGYEGLSNRELLNEMLDNRQIANEPGAVENYSNFGYFVLGRVIEKVSGLSYEAYIRQEILEPIGITTMRVGRNQEADKLEHEVVYYDQENYSPYLIDVTRMDAGGGWIASAEDLARFLVSVDRNSARPDLLPSGSLNYLYLSFGSWVFNGSMAGTASSLSRINDDLGGAVLVNTRVIPDTEMLTEINNLLTSQTTFISQWPEYDLFQKD